MAIYERWNEVKVSEAAERLSVSRKSASRCFDELEYLNIDVLGIFLFFINSFKNHVISIIAVIKRTVHPADRCR